MVKNLHEILCIVLILAFITENNAGNGHLQTPNIHPTFQCKDSSKIPLYYRCDGTPQCHDSSDELTPCASFYYSVDDVNSIDHPIIRGFYLDDKTTFRTTLSRRCGKTWKFLGAIGQFWYLQCTNETSDFILRMTRNGTIVNSVPVQGNLKGFAIDEITWNIYMIEDYHIKMCDELMFACIVLQSKYMNRPSHLAFYSKEGYLFWSEEKPDGQSTIIRSFRDGSSAIVIKPFSNTIGFLQINVKKQRLYWLNSTTGDEKNIISADFYGNDKKIIKQLNSNTPSFVTYADLVFYPDLDHNRVLTFKESTPPYEAATDYASMYSKTKLGENLIIYDPALMEKRAENPCNNMCSHLCTFISEKILCYCPTNEDGFELSTDVFCNGYTLLVSYGKNLYSIGFHYDFNRPPIVRKRMSTSFLISEIVYHPVTSEIFFVDADGKQIYSKQVGNESETLIHTSETNNSITNLQYDTFGNNLFWINPLDQTINAFSLHKNIYGVYWRGNSSYIPMQILLLHSNMGPDSLAIVFSKGNLSLSLEIFIPHQRIVVYKDNYTNAADIELLSISQQEVCLLNKSTEEIKCFTPLSWRFFKEKRSQDIWITGKTGIINQVVSLSTHFFWSENSNYVHVGKLVSRGHIESAKTVTVGLGNTSGYNSMKILAVSHDIWREKMTYNGCYLYLYECEHLCIPFHRNLFSTPCMCVNTTSVPCRDDRLGEEAEYEGLFTDDPSDYVYKKVNGTADFAYKVVKIASKPKEVSTITTLEPTNPETVQQLKVSSENQNNFFTDFFIIIGVILLVGSLGYVYLNKVKNQRIFHEPGIARLELIGNEEEH